MAAEAKILLTAEDKTRAAFESAKRGLQSMDSLASAAGLSLAALGGTVTLAGLVSMVKRINDNVDALNDLADATGASIENISGLERVAKLTGANMETVGQALVKYNQALGATLKPGSDAEKVLGAIGLNAKALRDMDPAEALRQTAVALNQFADDGNKARAVQELFGKSLREVAPFLKDLAEQGALQATVTTQQALEAEKFNKELFKMQTHVSEVGRAMAMELIPRLNNIMDTMRTAPPVVYDFWEEWASGLRRVSPMLAMAADVVRALSKPAAPPAAVLPDYVTDVLARGKGRTSLNLPPGETPEEAAERKRLEAERKRLAAQALAEAKREAEEIRKQQLAVGVLRNKMAEQAAEAEKKLADLIRKNTSDYLDGIQDKIIAASELVRTAEWELETYGMSRSAIAELTAARLEDARAMALLSATTLEDVAAIDAQIAAQRKLADIYRNGEARDASKKAAEDAAREWQKASDQISQSLTDALMNGGKSGADYVKGLFRTMVLRPIIQAAVQPVAGAVTNAIGVGGGGMGNLSALGSLGGAFGGGLSAGFGGLTGSIGGLFGAAGSGTTLGGALSAGSTALGAGNILGGLGTFAGALGPLALGIGALSKMFDSKGGPKTIGGASDAATIQATVAATLAQFGIKSTGLRVGGFSAADPQGDSLTQLQTALFRGDTALYSRQDRLGGFENVGRSSEELAAAWAEEQSRIMLAALQATLEPKYQQYLADVNADASEVDAINAALARLSAARTLEEQLLQLSSTDAENMARARQRELDAMDAALRPLQQRINAMQDEARIASKVNAVMADYLNDTELRAARVWQIQQQLGRAGLEISLERIAGASRADLRALYEEMVRIGDMGAAEALLDVASAFAQITQPANQAADAVEDMARRLQDAGRGVWDYVRTLTATRAGTASPMDLLGGTRSNYLQDLSLARAGDLDAYSRINSSAQAYIDAQKAYTASGGGTQALISQIVSELNSLPAVQSYEAQNLALLGQIAQATGATSTSTGGNKTTSDQILARLMQDTLLSYSRAEAAAVYNAIANNTATGASYLSNIAYHMQLMADRVLNGVLNVRSEYRAGGLATFEAGGFHTGGLRLVGERGPELEVTGPARIYNAQQTRSMLAGSGGASAEEIRGLREDVRRLIAVVAAGANANLGRQDEIVTNTRRVADRAELAAARP